MFSAALSKIFHFMLQRAGDAGALRAARKKMADYIKSTARWASRRFATAMRSASHAL